MPVEGAILLVDDDPLDVTRRLVEWAGFRAVQVPALRGLLSSNAVDSVVIDIDHLGDVAPLCVAAVRAEDALVSVVLVTEGRRPDLALAAFQHGATHVVRKPSHPERFAETIRAAVAHTRAGRVGRTGAGPG